MPRYTCGCGARFRFPESAIGKRSKCKQCGAVFTLVDDEAGVIPVADGFGAFPDAAPDSVADSSSPVQGRIFVPTGLGKMTPAVGQGVRQVAGDAFKPGFSTDVLWTFLFPSSPGNLITFVIIWVLMLILPSAPFGLSAFGLVVWILIRGWYTAYLFAVLESASAGEDELPSVTYSRDLLDDLVYPLFQWIGSWVVVYLPAGIYLLLDCLRGNLDPYDALKMLSGGIEQVFQQGGGQPIVFSILVCVGAFFWPMMILCIVLGGFETVYRLDLIASTIVRTLPVYVVTLFLMVGATLLERTLKASAAGISLWFVISAGVTVYFDIVLMRLIGLYYHHFKDRFAWSWG